jgi:hypothetical protein
MMILVFLFQQQTKEKKIVGLRDRIRKREWRRREVTPMMTVVEGCCVEEEKGFHVFAGFPFLSDACFVFERNFFLFFIKR